VIGIPTCSRKPQNFRIPSMKPAFPRLGELTFNFLGETLEDRIDQPRQQIVDEQNRFQFLFDMSIQLVLTRASGLLRRSAVCRRCIHPQFRFASSACLPQLARTHSVAYRKYNWEDPLELNSLLTDEEKQISYVLGEE
jgi:hypothetical protein